MVGNSGRSHWPLVVVQSLKRTMVGARRVRPQAGVADVKQRVAALRPVVGGHYPPLCLKLHERALALWHAHVPVPVPGVNESLKLNRMDAVPVLNSTLVPCTELVAGSVSAAN